MEDECLRCGESHTGADWSTGCEHCVFTDPNWCNPISFVLVKRDGKWLVDEAPPESTTELFGTTLVRVYRATDYVDRLGEIDYLQRKIKELETLNEKTPLS